MICPKCNAEMPDSAAYCIQCGAELSARHPARPVVRGNRARTVNPDGGQSGDNGGDNREDKGADTGANTGVVIGGFRFDAKPGKESGKRSGLLFGRPGGAAPSRTEWMPPAGYASPQQRLGAFVLDFLILGAGVFFMLFVLALLLPNLFENPETSATMGQLVSCALALLYYAGMESSQFQATPGKIALGFKVTDLRGRRIGFGRALLRHLAKIVSVLFFLLGYLMIFFTRRRQGLHDMIAGCVAVRREEGESTSG